MAGYVSPRRKALQTKANLYCALGFGLQIVDQLVFGAARGAQARSPSAPLLVTASLGFLLAIASIVCWFVGLSAYARSKGYASWLSLLGLFSCCGLVVMVLLPNQWIETPPTDGVSDDYPRPHG